MSILTLILDFIKNVFTDIVKDMLVTPAKEVSVESTESPLVTIATDHDRLLRMYDRSEGES